MKLRLIFTLLSVLATLAAHGRDNFEIPKAVIYRHLLNCPEYNTETANNPMKEMYTLPTGKYSKTPVKLYLIGCEQYAYNSSEYAYLESYNEIEDVSIAVITNGKSISATNRLMGTYFDEKNLLLYTYSKGRGMGDCGSSANYKYNKDFHSFELIEARLKEECDGSEEEWPVVYSR